MDVTQAALGAHSARFTRRPGGSGAGDLVAALARFWPTGDGWLRMPANYPWHRARAVALLE